MKKMRRILAWFSRFIHRKKKTEEIPDITEEFFEKAREQYTTPQNTAPHSITPHTDFMREWRKHRREAYIRERNLERRRATMGHGLKGKFKPRPAHEKRTWKLDKKPEDN